MTPSHELHYEGMTDDNTSYIQHNVTRLDMVVRENRKHGKQ